MKTWEMMKLVSENPSRVFENQDEIEFGGDEYELRFHVDDVINDEWVEVAQPVDFMTAFYAIREERKDIYCIYEDVKFEFKEDTPEQLMFGEELIAFGKWYIED